MDKLIAIVGPTGVGKTKLSIELALKYNAEIISCDSMQFYKGLDIGTAKIKTQEKQGVKHHLIDILNPNECFSVAKYQEIVRKKISQLHQKNILPILVGGSGLYISSILYDYKFLGKKRDNFSLYDNKSLTELVELLQKKVPNIGKNIDLANRRRVLRALDKNDVELDKSSENLFYKNVKLIALNLDREILYKNIEKRVDLMIEEGLIEEAKKLYLKFPDSQAAMAIGYKEIFNFFKGRNTLEESINLVKRNTRRYAKRQLTWFRNKMDCYWINVDLNNFDKVIEESINYIND